MQFASRRMIKNTSVGTKVHNNYYDDKIRKIQTSCTQQLSFRIAIEKKERQDSHFTRCNSFGNEMENKHSFHNRLIEYKQAAPRIGRERWKKNKKKIVEITSRIKSQ